MRQRDGAKIALEVLYDFACHMRPRDDELAEATFEYVLRELVMSEEFEQWKDSFSILPPEETTPCEGMSI